MDSACRMRKALATAVMKCPVNRASRSDTIFFGRPCILNTWSTKIFANPSALTVVVVAARWVIFVSLSTNTTMASLPLADTGRCVIHQKVCDPSKHNPMVCLGFLLGVEGQVVFGLTVCFFGNRGIAPQMF